MQLRASKGNMRAAVYGLSMLALLQWSGRIAGTAVGPPAGFPSILHHTSGVEPHDAAGGTERPSVVFASSQGGGKPSAAVAADDGFADNVLSFTCTNEYDAVEGSAWAHLAEPHRQATFEATSKVGDPSRNVYVWTFDDGTVLEGRSVTHVFRTLGRQQISLSQIDVATGERYTLETYVMVKYVRREIRQLTDADREAFFDAMETLYRMPTAEGSRKYGSDYKGIQYFVKMHLDGAGVRDCDHWHDDAGIMTHHVGYTLLFEQALQVVDPAVSIPYWEYTIDSSQGLGAYGDSGIFADDWFGSASPDNGYHTVDKGRWAYLSVMTDAWDYVHNSFGLLRSPWNADSTPFVTRHNMTNADNGTSMVSCETYEYCFHSVDMASMNNCLNGGTHGPVHIAVGGEWDNPEEAFINTAGYSDMVPLVTKYLWRKGYLRVPDNCSVVADSGGRDSSACRTSCPSELYTSRGMSPYDVLMDVNAVYWFAGFTHGTVMYDEEKDAFYISGNHGKEFDDAFWEKALVSLCDAGHVGELYTSAAPYDPLFWVIHPTAERLLSWRRKLGRGQGSEWKFDETWGYVHGNVVGETGVICDWSAVRHGTLDMPTCTKGICGGHKEDDILPFEIKVNGEIRTMSNSEWLRFIYPDNEDLPYLYNEFTWDHCAAEGAHFMRAPSGD